MEFKKWNLLKINDLCFFQLKRPRKRARIQKQNKVMYPRQDLFEYLLSAEYLLYSKNYKFVNIDKIFII